MRVTKSYGDSDADNLNEKCVIPDLNERALLIGKEGQDIARADST